MKKRCVFRIEFEGSLWRVEEERHPHVQGFYCYTIKHSRRVVTRVDGWNAMAAIETACRLAFGVNVDISWGKVL